VWTTTESVFTDPEVFFDLENAKDMCELVNTDIRNYRGSKEHKRAQEMGLEDKSSAFFVVLSIDLRVPWTGVKIKEWKKEGNG
tara:strand:- start:772 stop:1020 length:249 start_codon:yes stop_codon:yes gene_type:complete